MAIFLTNHKFYSLKPLEEHFIHYGGKYYVLDEGTLIKFFDDNINKRIDYLLSIPKHNHAILPNEAVEFSSIIQDYRSGYTVDYKKDAFSFSTILSCQAFIQTVKEVYDHVENAVPFEQFLASTKSEMEMNDIVMQNYSFDEITTFAKDLREALQHLHQYIILGDIHSDNILISEGKAYLNDLDEAKKIGEMKSIASPYYINNRGSYFQTKATDIVKLYIECLSLLTTIDFAQWIRRVGYKNFAKVMLDMDLPREVLDFLKMSLKIQNNKIPPEEAYHIEEFLHPEMVQKRNLIHQNLNNHYYY